MSLSSSDVTPQNPSKSVPFQSISIVPNNFDGSDRRNSSLSSTQSSSSYEDESYARTDYGLESPTIVSHLIETVRKESKMTSTHQNDPNGNQIPPALGFDEFQTLSSTKQNIELFKILSAIADEIEVLRKSTEQRFSLLESVLQQNKQSIYGQIIPSHATNGKTSRCDNNDSVESVGNSGTTTRPASWPREPNRNERGDSKDMDLLIAKNAAEDRPVILNVGGKKYEVVN